MVLSSIERALDAMAMMDEDQPYGLKPEDAKRRLAEELARLCREEGVSPIVIGGLAVNHHGYPRFKRHRPKIPSLRAAAARRLRTAEARGRLGALVARAREELARRR